MGELKSISGGKKEKDSGETLMCVYCGLAPAESHPLLTCPRISGVVLDSEWGISEINFLQPQEWAEFLVECNQTKAAE